MSVFVIGKRSCNLESGAVGRIEMTGRPHVHRTQQEAEAEALRLAETTVAGHEFVVFEARSSIRPAKAPTEYVDWQKDPDKVIR